MDVGEGRALEEVRGCNFGFSQGKKNKKEQENSRDGQRHRRVCVLLAGILKGSVFSGPAKMRSEVTRRSSEAHLRQSKKRHRGS